MESRSERWKELEATLLPTLKQMKEALGGIQDISEKRIQLAFTESAIDGRFEKMTIEDEDDWIPSMKNKGKSFSAYVKSNPNKVYDDKKTIYILALDKSISDEFLSNWQKYCSAFFYRLPVKILDNIDVNDLNVSNLI